MVEQRHKVDVSLASGVSPIPVTIAGPVPVPVSIPTPVPVTGEAGAGDPVLVEGIVGGVPVAVTGTLASSQLPATQAETCTSETKLVDATAPVAFSNVVLDFANGPINDPLIMLVHCEKIAGVGVAPEDVTITLEAEFPAMSMVAVGTYYAVADYLATKYYSFVLNDLTFGADATTQPYLFDANFLKQIKNIVVETTSATPHNVTLVFISPRGLV